jgi:hypothetical protein
MSPTSSVIALVPSPALLLDHWRQIHAPRLVRDFALI